MSIEPTDTTRGPQPAISATSLERWSGAALSAAEVASERQSAEQRASEYAAALSKALAADATPPPLPATATRLEPEARFAVAAQLNRKLILAKAPLARIEADAVVNPSNEALSSKNGISGDLLAAAGDEIWAEMLLLDGCKTGHAVLTRGYNLPATHVIHTVGPRFNAKYETAAQNALHNCYKNTLNVARENRLRSIAFAVVNSQRKGYPPEQGAHIALRTVRRYLEHYPDFFDTIMFCMVEGEVHFSVYRKLMPLYFPRNEEEFKRAQAELPKDCGDEWGETVIEERKIRISAKVKENQMSNNNTAQRRKPVSFANESTMVADDQLKPAELATMLAPTDAARRKAVREKSTKSVDPARREQYRRWLQASEKLEFPEIARLRYVYRAGRDSSGREMVIILGRQLPVKKVDLTKVLLYVVRVLAPLTGQPFTVTYIHGGVTSANDPPTSFLRQLYGLLDYPHSSSLAALYVVHPTFFLKVGFTLLSPFLSSTVINKLHYVDNLAQLFEMCPREALQLPDEIYKADTSISGRKWT